MTPLEIPGYAIGGRLGAGAHGEVFAARDIALERPVAIKVLSTSDPQVARRLRDEARLLARVDHPNVVRVFAAGTAADGRPWLAMERFGTGTVASLGAVSPELAASIVSQALRGLAAAHAAGVVHRDLKDSNLLVDASRRVKVCDFGVARALADDAGAGHTRTGAVVGTPGYIAPERYRGERGDPRSDQWGAGVVLYRLLAGRRPFEAADPQVVEARAATERPAPPPGPRSPVAVCVRLLAPDPADRFVDASAAADALEGGWLPPRRRWPFALLGASLLAVLGAWWGSRPEEPEEPARVVVVPPIRGAGPAPDAGAFDAGEVDLGTRRPRPATRKPKRGRHRPPSPFVLPESGGPVVPP